MSENSFIHTGPNAVERRLSSLIDESEFPVRRELHALISRATTHQLLPIFHLILQQQHPPLLLLQQRLNDVDTGEKMSLSIIAQWCKQNLQRKVKWMSHARRVHVLGVLLRNGVSPPRLFSCSNALLSNDIWYYIATFLPLESILQMRFIDRAWYDRVCSSRLWRSLSRTSLCLSTFSSSASSHDGIDPHGFGCSAQWLSLQQLQHLRIDAYSPHRAWDCSNCWRNLLCRLPNLQTLRSEYFELCSLEDADALASSCPLLEELCLCRPNDLLCQFRAPRHASITAGALERLADLPHLRRLRLSACEWIDSTALRAFLHKAHCLESLQLFQCILSCHISVAQNHQRICRDALAHRFSANLRQIELCCSGHSTELDLGRIASEAPETAADLPSEEDADGDGADDEHRQLRRLERRVQLLRNRAVIARGLRGRIHEAPAEEPAPGYRRGHRFLELIRYRRQRDLQRDQPLPAMINN